MTDFPAFNFLSRFESGHRADYIAFVKNRFPATRVTLRQGATRTRPLLFLMVEEWFGLFFLIALLRALFGLKTAGLLFRPNEAAQGKSLKMGLKRFMLRRLVASKHASVYTIIPHSICIGDTRIADGFVYDFQFWDASPEQEQLVRNATTSTPRTALASAIQNQANGRRIMVALGKQDLAKGAREMMQWYVDAAKIRQDVLFVVAGRLTDELRPIAEQFTALGGVLHDGFLGDDELFELYGIADLVWAHYRANYDQSSGIFARAVQFGVPSVVRDGSLIQRLADEAGAATLAISDHQFPDTADTLNTLAEGAVRQGRSDLAKAFEADARSTLRKGFGQDV